MARTYARRDSVVMSAARRMIVRAAFALALLTGPVVTLCAQPPTPAAQDEFLPVDESKPQEHLPAAPLVMGAYAIAWFVILGYVWSLWSRLARVEREIAEVSRRVEAGSRR